MKEIEERIELVHMKRARGTLSPIGRFLVEHRERTLWEQDTAALPRAARRWRKRAREFAQTHIRPDAPMADLHPEDYDHRPLMKAAARQGFLSMMVFRPIGAANINLFFNNPILTMSVVGEEFAAECGGLGLMLMAHNLGIAPLAVSGHIPTYLRHLVPIYLKYTWLNQPTAISYAITEPNAGSDVEETEGAARAKLITCAKPVKGGYLLNGSKCFISGGGISDKIVVFARIEGEGIESWTGFLVDKTMEGFSVGRKEKKMGQRASDASELFFDNVFIPKRNVIGPPRSGWANNRNVLNYSRPAVAAMAVGHGRGAFERALDFCRRTKLGQKNLIEYQDVQHELADMMITLSAARAMTWHSMSGFRCNQALSATAKVFAADSAFKVCNQAMELLGDHGYVHANGVERSMRDARLNQIYEGTNQINRLSLIEQQWDAEINRKAAK